MGGTGWLGASVGSPSTVPTGATGRYVRMLGSGPTLQLMEIEVVGTLP